MAKVSPYQTNSTEYPHERRNVQRDHDDCPDGHIAQTSPVTSRVAASALRLGPLASRTGDQAGFSAIDVRVYCCAKLPGPQSWLREEKCFAAEVLLERGRRLSAIRELARPQSVRATSGS